uniref:Uncharacterized protein n=1 Tax=Oncorhynchus kisutch TaxID=8019 RepID=A0A8C7LGD2_ONCKI
MTAVPNYSCYLNHTLSTHRQLSLDLVNVGRQRLDFLPMLEHSGTYRESTMHSGTFAQEIITLVHQVKEHYFRGDSVKLTERFCGAQDGLPEEEQEEEKPTLNRYTHAWQQQAVSDPGDLRHDLERRRQERLEGVKVTIPGGRYYYTLKYSEAMMGFVVLHNEIGERTVDLSFYYSTLVHSSQDFSDCTRRNNRSPNLPGNHLGPIRQQNRNINGQ